MKAVSVINLSETRELLAEWAKVRSAILAGRVAGFYAGIRSSVGVETLYLGGAYRDDPMSALKGIMKASAEARARARAPIEDNPVFWETMR